MKKKRGGRVKGRALAKNTPDLVEHSSWDSLFRQAIWGEGEYGLDLVDSVEMCLALEKRSVVLAAEFARLDYGRFMEALRHWLKKPDGTRYGKGETISYEGPEMAVEAARHSKYKDDEVLNHYIEKVELHRDQDRATQIVGGILVEAIRKRDSSKLLTMIEIAKRQVESGSKLMDPTRARFLFVVGKDANGQLRRNPPYNRNQLAQIVGCDTRTITRFCGKNEYGVTLQKGKSGRRPALK